jgi:hypothetical protein
MRTIYQCQLGRFTATISIATHAVAVAADNQRTKTLYAIVLGNFGVSGQGNDTTVSEGLDAWTNSGRDADKTNG